MGKIHRTDGSSIRDESIESVDIKDGTIQQSDIDPNADIINKPAYGTVSTDTATGAVEITAQNSSDLIKFLSGNGIDVSFDTTARTITWGASDSLTNATKGFDKIYWDGAKNEADGSNDALYVTGGDLIEFTNVETLGDDKVTIRVKTEKTLVPKDFLISHVARGLTASKDATLLNQLNVTEGVAYLKQSDGTFTRYNIPASTHLSELLGARMYLDLNPDGTWHYGTGHSTVSGYTPVAEVETDAIGDIKAIYDTRRLETGINATKLHGMHGHKLPRAHDILRPHVSHGGNVTKNSTTRIHVDEGMAYVLEDNDNLISRSTALEQYYSVSAASTTYFLCITTEDTYSWGTTHPSSNYLQIAEVTTDANGEIATITDVRDMYNGLPKPVIRETPSGLVDGLNKDFTLAKTPLKNNEVKETIFLDGIMTEDYTISGSTITFNTAPALDTKIRVTYYY